MTAIFLFFSSFFFTNKDFPLLAWLSGQCTSSYYSCNDNAVCILLCCAARETVLYNTCVMVTRCREAQHWMSWLTTHDEDPRELGQQQASAGCVPTLPEPHFLSSLFCPWRQGGAWRLSVLCPLHISCPAFSPHGAHVSLDVPVCYLVLEKPWDYPWSFFFTFFLLYPVNFLCNLYRVFFLLWTSDDDVYDGTSYI